MLLRPFLTTVCIFSLLATPALPQSAPPSATMASVPSPINQQTIANPRDLRTALRQWGLNRTSPDFRYAKRTIRSDRAEFENVVMSRRQGGTTSIEKLVITRNDRPGPEFGKFTIEGKTIKTELGDQIGGLTLVGVRGGANLGGFLSGLGRGGSVSPPREASATGGRVYIERLILTDFKAVAKSSANTMDMTFGEVILSELIFDSQLRGLKSASMRNITANDADISLTLGNLEIKEIGPEFIALLDNSSGDARHEINLTTLALGGVTLENWAMTFKRQGRTPLPLNTISLANLSLSDLRQGFIGQFGLTGFKADGLAGNQAWQVNLARVGMAGINLDYFSEVGNYFQATVKAATAGRAGATANPEQAAPAPKPRRVLKDLLRGGPLDSGFTDFDLADFRVSGGGFEFGLDRIDFNQQRDAAGQVTRADMAPSQMRVAWPNSSKEGGGALAGILSSMGNNEIVARFSLTSSYAPTTDLLTLESYRFEVVDWGSFNMGLTMSGLKAFMEQVSFSDLVQLSAPQGEAARKNPSAAISQLIALYRGISVNAGQIEISDSGGLDKAARIFGGTTRPRTSSPPANMSASQLSDIRTKWAEKPRAESGDKTKPALDRQFAIAIARWLEGGGNMTFTMTPTTPIAVTDLERPQSLNAQRLGLRITNRPASGQLATGR